MDLCKVGVGSLIGIPTTITTLLTLTAGLFVDGVQRLDADAENSKELSFAKKYVFLTSALSGTVATLSWWLFAKGWRMDTANGRLNNALKIERLVADAQVE